MSVLRGPRWGCGAASARHLAAGCNVGMFNEDEPTAPSDPYLNEPVEGGCLDATRRRDTAVTRLNNSSSAAKSKTVTTEAMKQNGKGKGEMRQ